MNVRARLAQADRRIHVSDAEQVVKAPIPGLVVKVLVEPDQEVEEGQTLLILEAMKMENELRRRGTAWCMKSGPNRARRLPVVRSC